MAVSTIPLILDAGHFPDEGLYLVFPDNKQLALTKSHIKTIADEYWNDPNKISPELRNATHFKPCGHCPHFGQDVLCNALKPLLPFIKEVDEYVSYDKVTAVYRGKDPGQFFVAHTTMQQAIQYLAILSLAHFCEMSERYSKFFDGIIPIMDHQSIINRLKANIFLALDGNKAEIAAITGKFREEILESTLCLIKRLKSVCRNDTFINAFVNTNLLADMASH